MGASQGTPAVDIIAFGNKCEGCRHDVTRRRRTRVRFHAEHTDHDYWESHYPVTSGAGVWERQGTQYVLQVMLMIHTDQSISLHGSRCVISSILAVNDPGTGTGWHQSNQTWALLAVVGTWIRQGCSNRRCGELSQPPSFQLFAIGLGTAQQQKPGGRKFQCQGFR